MRETAGCKTDCKNEHLKQHIRQTQERAFINLSKSSSILLLHWPQSFANITVAPDNFCNRLSGDPGPVIYGQVRIGKNGKSVQDGNSRSMYKNADKMLDQLTDEQRQQYITEFKIDNDPRITPVGNFLLKPVLDELPQLLTCYAMI